MNSAPCTGPCSVSLTDWLEYSVLLLGALGVLWVTYRVARGVFGSDPTRRRVIPIVTGGVSVVLTALLTVFATDEIARHAWPTVVIGNRGTDSSDPIALGGGYGVDWSAISGDAGCHLGATLRRADDSPDVAVLVSTDIPGRTNMGGSTTLMSLDRAWYYVAANSDCTGWSVTFTPRH
jgi:hypothetical protein